MELAKIVILLIHACLLLSAANSYDFSKRGVRIIHKKPIKSKNYYSISIVESENKIKPAEMAPVPVVLNTWWFTEGAAKAWEVLSVGGSALDAVEKGCNICEQLQCDRSVGFGGSPDENGETTLDAMIMDGETHAVGAVACLRRVKAAISVARKVMENTQHSILAGDLATAFAVKMGFKEESLTTSESQEMHQSWKNSSCQPNFWKNVQPDPTKFCGPYVPSNSNHRTQEAVMKVDRHNHDTISMLALDSKGRIASGTSSNGARNKIPGRVGDAPIVGAGSYVDKEVGGAASTGDGDVMMRFLPSLVAVEEMRRGASPTKAAEVAIARVARYYPNFMGAVIALNIRGEYGAACNNVDGGFPFSVRNVETGEVVIQKVACISVSGEKV